MVQDVFVIHYNTATASHDVERKRRIAVARMYLKLSNFIETCS